MNRPTKDPGARADAGKGKTAKSKPGVVPPQTPEHEGATEAQTGDRTGPAAGYDDEPAQVKDKGGVS